MCPWLLVCSRLSRSGMSGARALQQYRSRRLIDQRIHRRGKAVPARGGHGCYFTVNTMVVELLMAVTPVVDCAVTVTVYVPDGVAGVGVGPWL